MGWNFSRWRYLVRLAHQISPHHSILADLERDFRGCLVDDEVSARIELCNDDLQRSVECGRNERMLLLLSALDHEVPQAVPLFKGDLGYVVVEPIARRLVAIIGDGEFELALATGSAQQRAELGRDARLAVAVIFGRRGCG